MSRRVRASLAAFALALALALALAVPAAEAARITVTIDGVHSRKGAVMVAVFSRAEGFPDGDHADQWAKIPAGTGPLTVSFDGLTPGRYAVGAYHDENGNGRLDTNFIGWPVEGYALSNDVRLTVFRPRFTDAAFSLAGEEARVRLHMGY